MFKSPLHNSEEQFVLEADGIGKVAILLQC